MNVVIAICRSVSSDRVTAYERRYLHHLVQCSISSVASGKLLIPDTISKRRNFNLGDDIISVGCSISSVKNLRSWLMNHASPGAFGGRRGKKLRIFDRALSDGPQPGIH